MTFSKNVGNVVANHFVAGEIVKDFLEDQEISRLVFFVHRNSETAQVVATDEFVGINAYILLEFQFTFIFRSNIRVHKKKIRMPEGLSIYG